MCSLVNGKRMFAATNTARTRPRNRMTTAMASRLGLRSAPARSRSRNASRMPAITAIGLNRNAFRTSNRRSANTARVEPQLGQGSPVTRRNWQANILLRQREPVAIGHLPGRKEDQVDDDPDSEPATGEKLQDSESYVAHVHPVNAKRTGQRREKHRHEERLVRKDSRDFLCKEPVAHASSDRRIPLQHPVACVDLQVGVRERPFLNTHALDGKGALEVVRLHSLLRLALRG